MAVMGLSLSFRVLSPEIQTFLELPQYTLLTDMTLIWVNHGASVLQSGMRQRAVGESFKMNTEDWR